MKNMMDALNGGIVEQQNRRRNGLYLIFATSVLLIIAALILTVGAIVMAVSDDSPNDDPNEPSDDATAGYTTTTLDADTQLKTGALLLLDADHGYEGEAPATVLFSNHESRPKSADGKNIYTIFGTTSLCATEEAVVAFHTLLADFYAESGDDDLILDQAYDKSSGNQADEVYAIGTALSLSYYVNYNEDPANIASIFGVEEYEWIYENASKYGFIQVSREKGEENVFRFVGQPHATYMKKNNKTFSEYLKLLESRSYSNPLKITAPTLEDKNISYSVYRLTAEETAYVPEHGKYTVSGDNNGGYIITVNNTEGKKK